MYACDQNPNFDSSILQLVIGVNELTMYGIASFVGAVFVMKDIGILHHHRDEDDAVLRSTIFFLIHPQ